ncbi:MAG: OmpH family outer membrane protein [Candidatus Deferrimicrobiaceae bacterium]
MQKKLIGLFAAVVAAAILAAGPAFAQGLKVAVIDVNKVLNESEAGKVARKKMEDRYEELKKRIDALSEEAKKMKEELDKQKILLSKEKLKAKEEALGGKVAELRKVSQESETEMQSRQRDLTRDVLKIVEGQVDKIVKEEKIDLLLERSSGVVHFDPSLDITVKVLELVNKEKPGGK